MKKFSLAFLLLGFFIQSNAQLMGTYTIGNSASADYKTFNAAINAMVNWTISGAVIFEVESGDYEEQILLPPIYGASPTNTITFRSKTGNPNDVYVHFKPTDSANNYTIKLRYTRYIVIENLSFGTDTISGNVMEIADAAYFNQILNNTFYGKEKSILIYSSLDPQADDNYNMIKNNTLWGGQIGVQVCGYDQSHEIGNVIDNNFFFMQSKYGIYAQYQSGISIQNNKIQNQHTGIYLYACSGANNISNNVLCLFNTYNQSFGIRLYKTLTTVLNENLVSNNFVYMESDSTILGIDETASNYVFFINNSIHLAGNSKSSAGISLTTGSDVLVLNNNIINETSGTAITNGFANGAVSQYNNFYSKGPFIGNWKNLLVSNISGWQSVSGQDSNSISTFVQFCSDTNLHTNSTELDNKGYYFGKVSKDIDGDKRDKNHPDIGADEYSVMNLFIGNDTSLCQNAILNIHATPGFTSYKSLIDHYYSKTVNADFTVEALPNKDSMLLEVIATTNQGCNLVDSMKIHYYPLPYFNLGSDTSICADSQLVLKAPENYKTYKWSNGNGTNSIQITGKTAGTKENFWCKITSDQGCSFSDTIKISYIECFSGVEENSSNISIYPNPTKGFIYIDLGLKSLSNLELIDLSGKIVFEKHNIELPNTLNIGNIEKGIYLLKIQTDKELILRKVLVE